MGKLSKEQRDEMEKNNYVRELNKAYDVLKFTKNFFRLHAEMNATLHCAQTVEFSPLYGQVEMSMKGIKKVMKTWKRKVPQSKLEVPE